MSLVILILLGVVFLVALICTLGMWRAKESADKLHYLGPVTIICPILVCAAILIQQGISADAMKTVLIAVLLIIEAPIAAHVIGRAIQARAKRGNNEKL